jgi:hypothetical protein
MRKVDAKVALLRRFARSPGGIKYFTLAPVWIETGGPVDRRVYLNRRTAFANAAAHWRFA